MTQPPELDPVGEFMAEYLALPPEESAQQLEDWSREHPELREELQLRLRLLDEMGFPLPEFRFGAAGVPETLGEFRLLERLGSGGMGVVYRAEQPSLGREVALKLIRPELVYFEASRDRFQREVEAVAQLKHPGIVPIYSVGEENGLPYFAMEYVEGGTLSQALARLADRAPETLAGADLHAVILRGNAGQGEGLPPAFARSWTELCIDIALQLASALEHAHGHGILHRDVKPSNLALTLDGRVLLFDFGLTKSDGDDRLTESGSQVGTLYYMASEQLRGDRALDERADVYALGVTLYELLTLQVPFQGTNRIHTSQLILDGRPDPIRARNRRVPADLETVCLTAMEVDARRRYPSAAAFARDLRNVLERRPIEAQPPGALLRLRRYCQRKPGYAATAALALLAGVGVPTALYLQARAHAQELGIALQNEQAAKERAIRDRNRRALLAGFLVDAFREADPTRDKEDPPSAVDVLERGAQRIDVQLADDPPARAELMGVIGEVYVSLGQFEKARALLERAAPLVREVDASRAQLAQILTSLGEANRMLAASEASEANFQEALELWSALEGADSAEAAVVRTKFASLLNELQRFDETDEQLTAAIAALRADPESNPLHLARALQEHGGSYLTRARLPQREVSQLEFTRRGEARAREALAILEGHPVSGGTVEFELAGLWNELGLALKLLDAYPEAEAYYERALEAYRAYLGDDNVHVAHVESNLATLVEHRGGGALALPMMRHAFEVFDRELPESNFMRVVAQGNLAGMYARTEHYAEAEAIYEEVVPLQRAEFGEVSKLVSYSLGNMALCALDRGDLEGAQALWEEAWAMGLELHGARSKALSALRVTRAELALASGQLEAARAQLEEVCAETEGAVNLRTDLTRALQLLARVELASGNDGAVIELWQRLASDEGFEIVDPIDQLEARAHLTIRLAFELEEQDVLDQLAHARAELARRLSPRGPRYQALLAANVTVFEDMGLEAQADELRPLLEDE